MLPFPGEGMKGGVIQEKKVKIKKPAKRNNFAFIAPEQQLEY